MSFQPAHTSEDEALGDMQVTWEDIVQTSALFEEQHADDEQYYDQIEESKEGITYDMWLEVVYASERSYNQADEKDDEDDEDEEERVRIANANIAGYERALAQVLSDMELQA